MAVPLKQLLADSKRLVARDLFDPANAEVTFTISSNDLPSPSRPAGGRTFRGACRRLINVSHRSPRVARRPRSPATAGCTCRTGTNSRDRRRGTRSNRFPALAHASRPCARMLDAVDVLSHAVSIGRDVFQDDEALMPDAHAALGFCGSERPNYSRAASTVFDRMVAAAMRLSSRRSLTRLGAG